MTNQDLAQIRTIVEGTVGAAEARLQRSLEDGLTRVVVGMNARFDAVDRRFDRIEVRMSRLESRIENVETDVAELKLRFPRRSR